MKKSTRAGMNGKGFYAALSLSIAMVGAACWYAYSQAGKLMPPTVPQSSIAQETAQPKQTTAPPAAQTQPPVTITRPVYTTAPQPQEAEEAAAILRHTTPAETEPPAPAPAVTEAPVEQPILPVDGKVILPFSQGELIKSPTTGIWSTHNGVDIAVSLGTEVVAAEDGTVTFAGREALWGIVVTMLHENGTVTRYCGLNEGLNVQAGAVIPRGTVLGAVGDTNEAESAEETHLHFEVMQNDRYIDPASYFAGALQ